MAFPPDIVEFVKDPTYLGLSLSEAQETLLRTIYGLPLTSDEQLETFSLCTGREDYPFHGFPEITALCGARGGKDSRIAAPIVAHEACFGAHEEHLSKGERGTIVLVAQDSRASRIAYGYIRDYFLGSPLLRSMLAEEPLSSELHLTNGIDIACFPCTQRSLRGWSIPVGVLDEVAFFPLEGASDSDAEIQTSIRRGMIAFPSTRLVKISTPYMKSGILYDDFKDHFGQPSPDILCWRAPSILMNPSLNEGRLERERRLDPQRFSREYEAEFAEDLETFLPSAWVEASTVKGRHELPPIPGTNYVGAVDPSGGGADSFTLSIVHATKQGEVTRVIQDVARGWKKVRSQTVDLEGAVNDIAATLKTYGLQEVHGDRYAAQWVVQAFQRAGVSYRETEEKSKAYLECEPLFAQGRIEILDHPQLARELRLLERRPRSGGKTIIDHPGGGHDDHANALALAVSLAVSGSEWVAPIAVGSRLFSLERDEGVFGVYRRGWPDW